MVEPMIPTVWSNKSKESTHARDVKHQLRSFPNYTIVGIATMNNSFYLSALHIRARVAMVPFLMSIVLIIVQVGTH